VWGWVDGFRGVEGCIVEFTGVEIPVMIDDTP
jgi:hypothetical protein